MKNTAWPKILIETGHHAFLVVGNNRKNDFLSLNSFVRSLVSEGLAELSDTWFEEFESLGIEEARGIKNIQSTKPIGRKRFIGLSISNIQVEAQNSLLKLFEEPSSDTVFFIFVDNSSIIIPTLLSRFHIFNSDSGSGERGIFSAESFLKSSVADRLGLIEEIVKTKDKGSAISFLDSLELALYEKNKGRELVPSSVFETIFSARHFLKGRSPSIKMILENICLTVPFR